MTDGLRVAVLGGGVIGTSVARHLARSGVSTLHLTGGGVGGPASHRSLSWLNSASQRSETYHRLRTAGLARYRALAARDDHPDWLRFDGALRWVDDDATDQLRADHERELDLGYPSVWLDRTAVTHTIAGVDASALPQGGALWNPAEGWVELPRLVDRLRAEMVASGGEIDDTVGESAVIADHGTVRAVRTPDGQEHAVDAAVIATGAAVPRMSAELGFPLPDATPLALLVRTRPVDHRLTAVLNTPRVAVRPAPGGVLAVDADWVTPSVAATPSGWSAPAEVVAELLAEASGVLEGRPALHAAEVLIGLKPMPTDGEPVVGPLPGVPGCFIAFTHSGATLGLVIGELLTDQVRTGRADPLLAPYDPARLASGLV